MIELQPVAQAHSPAIVELQAAPGMQARRLRYKTELNPGFKMKMRQDEVSPALPHRSRIKG